MRPASSALGAIAILTVMIRSTLEMERNVTGVSISQNVTDERHLAQLKDRLKQIEDSQGNSTNITRPIILDVKTTMAETPAIARSTFNFNPTTSKFEILEYDQRDDVSRSSIRSTSEIPFVAHDVGRPHQERLIGLAPSTRSGVGTIVITTESHLLTTKASNVYSSIMSDESRHGSQSTKAEERRIDTRESSDNLSASVYIKGSERVEVTSPSSGQLNLTSRSLSRVDHRVLEESVKAISFQVPTVPGGNLNETDARIGRSGEIGSKRGESAEDNEPTSTTSSRKDQGSKSKNELMNVKQSGSFVEIKSSRKASGITSMALGRQSEPRFPGLKIVQPNVASALGKYAPYFEDGEEEQNVTARVGSTALLDCKIGMLGNKTVTWSYHNPDVFRLLTVGRNPYSVDQRISLAFRYPTNWRLQIQYASPRDSGLYECQVATYPPLVKKIHVVITAPILAIMDDSGLIKSGERHLKAGSALRLRCEARDVPDAYNESVVWTRGDETLIEDVSENRTTEILNGREIQVVVSTITVEKATPRHAGNYSCSVPEKARTTVAVHVLNGELPAAVHDGSGVSRSVLNLWLIHLTVSYVFSR